MSRAWGRPPAQVERSRSPNRPIHKTPAGRNPGGSATAGKEGQSKTPKVPRRKNDGRDRQGRSGLPLPPSDSRPGGNDTGRLPGTLTRIEVVEPHTGPVPNPRQHDHARGSPGHTSAAKETIVPVGPIPEERHQRPTSNPSPRQRFRGSMIPCKPKSNPSNMGYLPDRPCGTYIQGKSNRSCAQPTTQMLKARESSNPPNP